MANSPFQKIFNFVYEKLSKNTSTMLVVTGSLGWALSSAAQIFAVATNPKLSNEQKSFLLPQEMMDACVNIGTFLLITQMTKKIFSKMASTGKIAPQNIRKFLNKDEKLKTQIGKLSLDIDELIKNNTIRNKKLIDSYYAYKNYTTAVATVGAGIIASNIITPILRNNIASNVQKSYIEKKSEIAQPNEQIVQNINNTPQFKGYNNKIRINNNLYISNYGMKI